VQVDPVKPTLKPPGTKRLKLNCDESMSNFACNFNLRRYSKVSMRHPYMLPDVSVIDPELTLSMPRDVTAHTGRALNPKP
jgi:hypothetical protein